MSTNIKIRFSIAVIVIISVICAVGLYYRSEIIKLKLSDGNTPQMPDLSQPEQTGTVKTGDNAGNKPVFPVQTTASGLKLPTLKGGGPSESSAEAEKRRRDGYMWVDRVTDQYIVTLGNINGVFPGGYLAVYDNDIRVGQVRVLTSYDVISYVEPLEREKSDMTKDYYQVYNE